MTQSYSKARETFNKNKTRNIVIIAVVAAGVITLSVVGAYAASGQGLPGGNFFAPPEKRIVQLSPREQDKANINYQGLLGISVTMRGTSGGLTFPFYPVKSNSTLEAFVGESLLMRNGTSKIFWFNSTSIGINIVFLKGRIWYTNYFVIQLPSYVSLSDALNSINKFAYP